MIAQIAQKQSELAELCEQFRVRRLEIFGSASEGHHFDAEKSDLDFLVDFDPSQPLGPWLKHYFDFREALEQLFQRPVDLVMTSALKSP